ncbi:MAG: hypothetical protein H0W72_11120 [Planctomycetes bacterium]|nr:hypothetical protein [Planctomycetota bacterium]
MEVSCDRSADPATTFALDGGSCAAATILRWRLQSGGAALPITDAPIEPGTFTALALGPVFDRHLRPTEPTDGRSAADWSYDICDTIVRVLSPTTQGEYDAVARLLAMARAIDPDSTVVELVEGALVAGTTPALPAPHVRASDVAQPWMHDVEGLERLLPDPHAQALVAQLAADLAPGAPAPRRMLSGLRCRGVRADWEAYGRRLTRAIELDRRSSEAAWRSLDWNMRRRDDRGHWVSTPAEMRVEYPSVPMTVVAFNGREEGGCGISARSCSMRAVCPDPGPQTDRWAFVRGVPLVGDGDVEIAADGCAALALLPIDARRAEPLEYVMRGAHAGGGAAPRVVGRWTLERRFSWRQLSRSPSADWFDGPSWPGHVVGVRRRNGRVSFRLDGGNWTSSVDFAHDAFIGLRMQPANEGVVPPLVVAAYAVDPGASGSALSLAAEVVAGTTPWTSQPDGSIPLTGLTFAIDPDTARARSSLVIGCPAGLPGSQLDLTAQFAWSLRCVATTARVPANAPILDVHAWDEENRPVARRLRVLASSHTVRPEVLGLDTPILIAGKPQPLLLLGHHLERVASGEVAVRLVHMPPTIWQRDERPDLEGVGKPYALTFTCDRIVRDQPLPPGAIGHLQAVRSVVTVPHAGVAYLEVEGILIRTLPVPVLPIERAHELDRLRAALRDRDGDGLITGADVDVVAVDAPP